MDVDGWEIYVKETRPKGQRLPNEVDPARAQVAQAPTMQDDATVASSNWQLLESVDAALPGEPEHFEPHEVKEPEMDGELIDAILKPFLDRLPGVSDERDIDEPDADEEIVFREPIVGGSALMFSQRKGLVYNDLAQACSAAPKGFNVASPKPSPPPTPKSAIGSPKPEPPALPAEAADHPMPKALPFKAPPATLTTTSPRAPPQKSSASAATSSSEPAPKMAKKEPPMASAPPPGTGGPQPPAEPPLRPHGYPKWYFFSPGTGERREFTIRCTDLPDLRDLGRLGHDDFKFSKRVTGLLRGYDHKFLEAHHRHIPPEFG